MVFDQTLTILFIVNEKLMKTKFFTTLSFLSFFLYACTENEQPDIIYGEYSIESMVSSDPMDITGVGDVTDNFWKQIQSTGQRPESFRLNLYSPEHSSVTYSQIVFNLPLHLKSSHELRIERSNAGRKFEKQSDGSMTLGWNTHIYPGSPYQLEEHVLVNRINIDSRNQIVHLEVVQNWYDHSKGEWRDTTINYRFKKRI